MYNSDSLLALFPDAQSWKSCHSFFWPGAFDFLQKTVELGELIVVLNHALKTREQDYAVCKASTPSKVSVTAPTPEENAAGFDGMDWTARPLRSIWTSVAEHCSGTGKTYWRFCVFRHRNTRENSTKSWVFRKSLSAIGRQVVRFKYWLALY